MIAFSFAIFNQNDDGSFFLTLPIFKFNVALPRSFNSFPTNVKRITVVDLGKFSGFYPSLGREKLVLV